MKRIPVTLLLIAAVCGCRAKAPATFDASADRIAKGRAFVAEFYDWYWKPGATKDIDSAMADRRSSFAPDLAALIDSDNACAARAHGECRLEEDPILASQDPCERYEVGGALPHGDTVGVSIFGVCDGKRDTVPAVIAMVVGRDSAWQFTNFVYPAGDLRSILAGARPDDHPELQGEVQAFYDWYFVNTDEPRTAQEVLNKRPQVLDRELRSLLAANRGCAGSAIEACRPRFDPFGGLQDPDLCVLYRVGAPHHAEEWIEFPIYLGCLDSRDTARRVTARVVARDSGWTFTDFEYPGGRTLKSMLQETAQ